MLRAIRDGRKYTKANRVLAPLAQRAWIECFYGPNGTVKEANLTTWGEIVLADYERTR